MSTASTLKVMQDARAEARQYQHKIEADKERQLRAAEERIERELKPRREHLADLRRIEVDAVAAWHSAKIEDTRQRAGKGGMFAIGTSMAEWKNGRSYFGSPRYDWSKTGRVGTIQIWTPETSYPENQRWGLPSPGDLFIRILKKDGKESLNYETLRGNFKGTWMPEGQKPGRHE